MATFNPRTDATLRHMKWFFVFDLGLLGERTNVSSALSVPYDDSSKLLDVKFLEAKNRRVHRSGTQCVYQMID